MWAVSYAEQGGFEAIWVTAATEEDAMQKAEKCVLDGDRDVRVWRLQCEAQRDVKFVREADQ